MQLLDYPQLVRALGVSRSTLEDAVRCGQLVATRIGRRVLFAPEDVQRYVESHRSVPRTAPPPPIVSTLSPAEHARRVRAELGL